MKTEKRVVRDSSIAWSSLYWPRPLDVDGAAGVLRVRAADSRSPMIVLETRATAGKVGFMVGTPVVSQRSILTTIERQLPGVHAVVDDPARVLLQTSGRIHASTRHRPLRVDPLNACRAILSALAAARTGEHVALQLVLGPHRAPLAVADARRRLRSPGTRRRSSAVAAPSTANGAQRSAKNSAITDSPAPSAWVRRRRPRSGNAR
jgi:hypothetical protein